MIPALPLIFIRPFLPESPEWQRKRDAGQLRRPSIRELFSPELCRTTIVTTLIFAASYGLAFGAIQQLPQILGAPKGGHAQILATAKAAQDHAVATAKEEGKPAPSPGALKQIARNATDAAVAKVAISQEIGGLVGRLAFAFIAVWAITRRNLFRIFQIPSLIIVPLLFFWISRNLDNAETLPLIKAGIFIAGFFTVAQFSFWGNYIPLVFPLHLRGTGESFAANIGGRILGTSAAWLTLTFSESIPPSPVKLAVTAALVAGGFALVGAVLTKWLPEPNLAKIHD